MSSLCDTRSSRISGLSSPPPLSLSKAIARGVSPPPSFPPSLPFPLSFSPSLSLAIPVIATTLPLLCSASMSFTLVAGEQRATTRGRYLEASS